MQIVCIFTIEKINLIKYLKKKNNNLGIEIIILLMSLNIFFKMIDYIYKT